MSYVSESKAFNCCDIPRWRQRSHQPPGCFICRNCGQRLTTTTDEGAARLRQYRRELTRMRRANVKAGEKWALEQWHEDQKPRNNAQLTNSRPLPLDEETAHADAATRWTEAKASIAGGAKPRAKAKE